MAPPSADAQQIGHGALTSAPAAGDRILPELAVGPVDERGSQVELLNRRRWKTRIELASGIHYIDGFHNARRRHSSLGMRTRSNTNSLTPTPSTTTTTA